MLPREQRLRSNQEFQRVFRRGRSWAHPLLALHIVPADEGSRIGFSASKKVGGAVVRNRVRRRLREIVRARIGTWKIGFDAVWIVRSAAATATFAQLEDAVQELSRRARLIVEPGGVPDSPYLMPAGGRPARPPGSSSGAGARPAREP